MSLHPVKAFRKNKNAHSLVHQLEHLAAAEAQDVRFRMQYEQRHQIKTPVALTFESKPVSVDGTRTPPTSLLDININTISKRGRVGEALLATPSAPKLLGVGRYSTVYVDTFVFPNQAVKIGSSPQDIEREVSILQAMGKHPHVANLIRWDGRVSMYMPIYKPLPVAPSHYGIGHLRTLAMQLFEALAFLHDQSIVHGDIKPENLMLDPEGDGGGSADPHLVLVDFGQAIKLDAVTPTTYKPVLVTGTTMYSAPESLSLMHPVYTPSSDIYSAGATLYSLITSRRPFETLKGAQLIIRIREGFFRARRTLGFPQDPFNPIDAPKGICKLIVWCTALDAEERPSAKKVLEYLYNSETAESNDF